MKKHLFNKMGLFACGAALAVSVQTRAADLASASGVLADIAVMVTQSSEGLASAANGGDVNATADAQKRSDAVNAAMTEGQEAYAAIENAVAAGDDDAAASASDDLDSAWQKAYDALNGAVPELSEHAKWEESQKNTGGGPGRAYDPPNIYYDPSHSPNMQALSADLFGNIMSASMNGSDPERDGGDRDATPE
jgi:hypothetical protein